MSDFPILEETDVTVFATKFVSGGERGVHAPLLALLERWDSDVHYTLYTEPTQTRLRKDMARGAISFNAMTFDFDAHGEQKPTAEDFDKLVALVARLRHRPTWISQSRSGAHLVYATTTITDPAQYEATRAEVLSNVLAPIDGKTIYALDRRTPDWTRLFRAARTTRLDHDDDGAPSYTDLRDSRIVILHGDVLDLAPFIVAPAAQHVERRVRPVRTGSSAGERRFDGHDGVVRNFLNTMHPEGERNPTLFKACCWVWKRYVAEDAEILIDLMQQHAQTEGLPEHETEAVAKSAHRCVMRERDADVR